MYKKTISILLLLMILFSNVLPVSAKGSPTITVSSATAKPGETITLSVNMSNNPGINTFSFGFSYDNSRLTLVDVKASSKLGGQFVYKKKAVWLNSKDSTYNGEIMTLKFKVAKDAEPGDAKVRLTCSAGDISNYNEQNVKFQLNPGIITVQKIGSSSSGSSGGNLSLFSRILAIFKNLIERIKSVFHVGA